MSLISILLQAPNPAAINPEQTDSVSSKITTSGNATIRQIEDLASTDTIDKIIESLINFGFKLGIAILVFIAGKFIIKSLHAWVRRLMLKRDADLSLTTFILSLIRITLYFILIVTVIGILGIETSSFLALFASAGVAIGLALSGTLQNFAGGVLILMLKPYKVGEIGRAHV